MRFRSIAAAALAPCLALSLSGCFAIDVAADAAGTAADIANQAASASEAISNIDWTKAARLDVIDAATGKTVAQISDDAVIAKAFEGLTQENALVAKPDSAEEYRFELHQSDTLQFGEDASSNGEILALELATYAGTDTVRLTVSPIGLTVYLNSAATADSLRQLAA